MATTRSSAELDELWERFHGVVNMTSRELVDWLGVQPDLDGVVPPEEQRRPPLGVAVVRILAKRRVDLTDGDCDVMTKVIDVFEEETAEASREEQVSDERRRHRLMNVGHDPLREG